MNYDEIAPEYDSIYSGDEFKTENLELSDIIRFSGGRVLDVGCGTGELVSVINPTKREYLGIDPSVGMLREFRFEGFTTICRKVTSISETFEFAIGKQTNLVDDSRQEVICPHCLKTYYIETR